MALLLQRDVPEGQEADTGFVFYPGAAFYVARVGNPRGLDEDAGGHRASGSDGNARRHPGVPVLRQRVLPNLICSLSFQPIEDG